MRAIFNRVPEPGKYLVLVNPSVKVLIEIDSDDVLELSKNHLLSSREVTVQGYGREYPGNLWVMVDPKHPGNATIA